MGTSALRGALRSISRGRANTRIPGAARSLPRRTALRGCARLPCACTRDVGPGRHASRRMACECRPLRALPRGRCASRRSPAHSTGSFALLPVGNGKTSRRPGKSVLAASTYPEPLMALADRRRAGSRGQRYGSQMHDPSPALSVIYGARFHPFTSKKSTRPSAFEATAT